MRSIHLDDSVQLRFPGRSADFDEGVEIGVAATLMNMALPEFSRLLSVASLDQIRALATKLGYAMTESEAEQGADWRWVAFRRAGARPAMSSRPARPGLRLVSG